MDECERCGAKGMLTWCPVEVGLASVKLDRWIGYVLGGTELLHCFIQSWQLAIFTILP